jgi:hypothetical protein
MYWQTEIDCSSCDRMVYSVLKQVAGLDDHLSIGKFLQRFGRGNLRVSKCESIGICKTVFETPVAQTIAQMAPNRVILPN